MDEDFWVKILNDQANDVITSNFDYETVSMFVHNLIGEDVLTVTEQYPDIEKVLIDDRFDLDTEYEFSDEPMWGYETVYRDKMPHSLKKQILELREIYSMKKLRPYWVLN